MLLITGGTGYIGSNTAVKLLEQNEEIINLDNLYNSKQDVLNNIQTITTKKPKFYETDLLDIDNLEKIFQENKIDCVIHFAGLKAVANL